jgi:hypothetical protein
MVVKLLTQKGDDSVTLISENSQHSGGEIN